MNETLLTVFSILQWWGYRIQPAEIRGCFMAHQTWAPSVDKKTC